MYLKQLLLSTVLTFSSIALFAQESPEQTRGYALHCTGENQHAQVNGVNYNAKRFTFAAWVKPTGIQADYAGIVMSDGAATGMNFREGNNTLGYHWSTIGSASWNFDSNLIIEPDVWSHVAMVTDPDGVTLYVNGIGVRHDVTLYDQYFTSFRIGSYQGWPNRNFNGLIDEVSFFKRSLTQEQIRELMHLTLVPSELEEVKLKHYYQFNNPDGDITDRAGENTGTPMGGAQRVVSDGPFGGGVSKRLRVEEGGLYDFEGTDLQLIFDDNASVFPDGDMVVNKIVIAPDQWPTDTPLADSCYWIINNYGDNQTFDEVDAIVINDQQIEGTWANVSQYKLYKRGERDFGDTWGEEIDYANIKLFESLIFNDGDNLTSSGQLSLIQGQPLVGLEALHLNKINAYPNPINGGNILTFELENNKNQKVNFYDNWGRQVFSAPLNTDNTVVVPSYLATGTYTYILYTNSIEGYGKLVIE